MRSFISRVANLWRTRRLPRAGADCGDFIRLSPTAPTPAFLSAFVLSQRPDAPPAAVRAGVFDLLHRCGAAGRCACEGSGHCRFPLCATMRPVTKGAEVLSARRAVEDEGPSPSSSSSSSSSSSFSFSSVFTSELIALAREERLAEAIEGIARHAEAYLQREKEQRERENEKEKGTELVRDVSTQECVAALYMWRAALLVNTREDERAVASLLNLSARIPCDEITETITEGSPEERIENCRARLIAAATTWAALNDMEIIYYRSLLQQYQSFPLAESFARDRPLLLRRVFEYLRSVQGPAGTYLMQCAAHIVFAKEVTAAVSRAKAAQDFSDFSEDPLHSACIPLALQYYRFCVDEVLWSHMLNLLSMPPCPPRTKEEEEEVKMERERGFTPTHVLDAMGRSMILHHLLKLHEAREAEIASGAVAESVQRAAGDSGAGDVGDVHPARYERVLSQRDAGIVVARMQELLQIVRGYEESVRAEAESQATKKKTE